MKKALSFILILIMMLSGAQALASAREGDLYRIIPLQTEDSRVKLRRRPSTDAEILGQYFAGTEIKVLSWEGDWVYGSIAGQTGYMMRKFLSPADPYPLNDCPYGCARYEEAPGMGVGVRWKPAKNARVTMTLNKDEGVTVLGTVGEDWLHIAVVRGGKETEYGFVPSDLITQVDNFARAVVDSKHADETVNLRAAPSTQAQVLGKLFSGVQVSRLFDDHVVGDGWDRVRVGDAVGYIQERYLDNSSAGCPNYRPPMAELRDRNRPLYADAARKNQTGMLDIYDPFSVLGVFGTSYLVRAETWVSSDEWDYEYGYLAMSDVKARVTASASTTGTLMQDAPIYRSGAEEQPLEQMGTLNKDRVMFIYGAVDGQGNWMGEYISPDAAYLMVETVLSDGGGLVTGFVPVDAVEYDHGLNYPESMTLGKISPRYDRLYRFGRNITFSKTFERLSKM